MASLTRDAVLKQYDKLQDEGELFYTPSKPIRYRDGGLDFEFRLVNSFNSKPQVGEKDASGSTATAQSAKRPKPSDGSDIDHSDPAFFVANVSHSNIGTIVDDDPSKWTHKLILNKFCVFRPQYILLTTNPLSRQTSPLNRDDLAAAHTMLKHFAADREHYVLFNCGREGGSSRLHKHMQVLETPIADDPDGERSLLWPHVTHLDPVAGQNTSKLALPFLAFGNSIGAADDAERAYKSHLSTCREIAGKGPDEDLPHNVIMTTRSIVIIPRRVPTVEGVEGHVVNATGMMGLIWCSSEAQFEGWKRTGPAKVLSELGYPP